MTSMSLAEIQQNLDYMMLIIEESEKLTTEQIDQFMALRKKREEKIDGWIGYRDRAKHYIAELKERRDRFQKAYKAAQSVAKQIDERIRYYLENDNTGLAFKGQEMGTLYLQKNSQKSLAHLVPVENVNVYNVVKDDHFKSICKNYLKDITLRVLDSSKVKADIERGVELPWATVEQGQHVRVKG